MFVVAQAQFPPLSPEPAHEEETGGSNLAWRTCKPRRGGGCSATLPHGGVRDMGSSGTSAEALRNDVCDRTPLGPYWTVYVGDFKIGSRPVSRITLLDIIDKRH